VTAMIALGVTRFGINTEAALALIDRCAAAPGGVQVIAGGR